MCNLTSTTNVLTIIYEDNTAFITQIKGEYIKGDKTKYISPKLKIDVKRIRSTNNFTNIFTNALP